MRSHDEHPAAWRALERERQDHAVTPETLSVVMVGDSALATFEERVQGTQQGQPCDLPFGLHFCWTAHFVREAGRWWLLAGHASRQAP